MITYVFAGADADMFRGSVHLRSNIEAILRVPVGNEIDAIHVFENSYRKSVHRPDRYVIHLRQGSQERRVSVIFSKSVSHSSMHANELHRKSINEKLAHNRSRNLRICQIPD